LRRLGEVGEEGPGSCRVWNRDRGHGVFEDVDAPREFRVPRDDRVEKVVDRTLHAVARSLPGDDEAILAEKKVEKSPVPGGEGRAVVGGENFGREDRVVLGEGVHALDLDAVPRAPDPGVEEAGFLDHTH